MKKFSVLFLALFLTVLSNGAAAARNMLLIFIDDMRVDEQAITPNLDALAEESTVYTNAYTTSLYCIPSRTTSMFGLSPKTHQVGLTQIFIPDLHAPPYSAVYANPEVRSLPEILKDHGYTTAVAGKVFHEPEPDRWDINGPAVPWNELWAMDFFEGGIGFMQAGIYPAEETHPDQATANFAINFIDTHQGGPFFLAVGFFLPHLPWVSPQWAYDAYGSVTVNEAVPGDLDDEPEKAVSYVTSELYDTILNSELYDTTVADSAAEMFTRAYLAGVTHTDEMIGQVIAALDASQYADNTDVIVLSDHGYHLGEKRHWQKITYWQETVRVPFLIRSAAIPSGEVNEPVSTLDLAPTVLDLADAISDPQHEGVSLRNGRSPVKIYHEYGEATVEGNTKSIDYDTRVSGSSDRATYDLLSDPKEITNLVVSGC